MAKKKAKKKAKKTAKKKTKKKVTAKKTTKKAVKKAAVKKAKKKTKKKKTGKKSITLIQSDESHASIKKQVNHPELAKVNLFVRAPDSARREKVTALGRLCSQTGACVGIVEHE